MRAEDTLQFMMDFQGGSFYNRQKCLNHLFCTIGNGYEWINGELVEITSDTEEILSRWALKGPIEYAKPRNHIKELGEMKDDIQYRIHKRKKMEIPKWSSLSKKYSYLFNYPEDIKPDWKVLLEECKRMLIDDGIDIENIPD